jgi:phosphoribosyl 1,2-cyclic phosphate phosphodiesterase
MLKITLLGTGTSQGVPVIACTCKVCTSANKKDARLRCAVLVESTNTTFVIDSGPDFRFQMLRAGVKKLDAVLFTHEHKDHVAGLDDIRPFNYINKKVVDIFATKQVQEALKREFSYIFSGSKYPGLPEINLVSINNQRFSIGDIEVQPIPVMHHRLPVLGFRINDFVYVTDANYISDASKALMLNADIIVLNALRHESHISHYTLQQAIDLIYELKPKKAYLTHISHQMGLYDDVIKELPDNIYLAYDGQIFSL